MVTTEAPKKIKFWSPDSRRISYKAWEDMSEAEHQYLLDKQPGLVPDHVRATIGTGRYADLLEFYTDRMEQAKGRYREARLDRERLLANDEIAQYREAIELLKEAETIPEGTDTQFAIQPGGREFFFRLPPHLDEFKHAPIFEPIQFHRHVFRTDNPVYIAALRRTLRAGYVEGLAEVGVGQYPLIGRENWTFLGYGPLATYETGVSENVYRP
jgi:hypothetical protein